MVFGTDSYYFTSEKPLYEGQIATTIPCNIRDSYYSNVEVPFGRALTWDEPGKSVKPVDAPGQQVIGVSMLTHIYESPTVNGSLAYPAKKALSMLDVGEIAVIPEDAIDLAVSNAVYVRVVANGGFTETSRFRGDADGGNAELVPNARWVDSGESGKELTIHFDNPVMGY